MNVIVAIGIGLVAGVASGVAGIGGGVIMVPAMVALLGTAQHTAEGTSLLAILFTGVAGTVVNQRNRRVDLRAALTLGVVGALAAPFGAVVAQGLPADTLRRVFGVFVLLTAARMFWQLRSVSTPSGPAPESEATA